jgi:hypothetical protein
MDMDERLSNWEEESWENIEFVIFGSCLIYLCGLLFDFWDFRVVGMSIFLVEADVEVEKGEKMNILCFENLN